MNIFCTSRSPVQSALWLDDIRINKMILESAQMLSTGVRLHCDNKNITRGLYKIAFQNHPCSVWARYSSANFQWLLQHALAMCVIYEDTNGKPHKTLPVLQLCQELSSYIPEGGLTEFANCTPFKGVQYQQSDVTVLYRMFMRRKWHYTDTRRPTWTNRQPPQWSQFKLN